jgi:hypothetical protein
MRDTLDFLFYLFGFVGVLALISETIRFYLTMMVILLPFICWVALIVMR